MNTLQITEQTRSIENNNTIDPCRCMARIKTNVHKQCSRKKKQNSDLCGIHMRAKHVIRINEDIPTEHCPKINFNKRVIGKYGVPALPEKAITYKDLERNKFNSKKFKYRHILDSLQTYKIPNLKNKQKNFIQLQEYISIRYHTKVTYTTPFYITKIRLITKIYRGYQLRKINILKGPGFLHIDNVNNKTDFLNFIDIRDIGYYHFISYKDNHDCIYAFHLDSLLSYISELKKINKKKKGTFAKSIYTGRISNTVFTTCTFITKKNS